MATLYELVEEYRILLQTAQEDVGDEDYGNTIEGALSSLIGSIGDKTENICKVVKMLESEADELAKESERIVTREVRRRNGARRLRDYLKVNIEMTGQKKIEGLLFTASIRKAPLSCEVVDEAQVPVDWKIQPPLPPMRVDKTGIINNFKVTGEMPPGTAIKQNTYLKID